MSINSANKQLTEEEWLECDDPVKIYGHIYDKYVHKTIRADRSTTSAELKAFARTCGEKSNDIDRIESWIYDNSDKMIPRSVRAGILKAIIGNPFKKENINEGEKT